ncbi:unnamed protein product [Eruca vesicaria subsp. sativa]|uniref:Uncharacterized protein n=1 Tax=Eruca vesicaria subsp. sativa TaxID=29727 RepID=A0ABC8LGZ2_ERUVS|nr:unnamed protein product [Eruca vesicaria subsp. sativa]
MADVENQPDSSFPVKRKPDLCCQEQDSVANKSQKLNHSTSSDSRDVEVSVSGAGNLNSSTDGETGTEASNSLEEASGSESGKDENAAGEKQEGGEEEENDGEEENDRKGKGLSREDKGKGKLIEFDESESSDDEDEYGDEYDESELSDDPLAEVDLDNILPSRTRRRSIQPGVYISSDLYDDDDSSDD